MSHDVGIIGAGPAGIAAAVQLGRHGLRPLVFERGTPGGLLRTAWRVENFPGFPRAIRGPELARLLADQLRASGAELVRDEVVSLDRDGELFLCSVGGRTLSFAAVVVASGTKPRLAEGLDVSDEARASVFREVEELWGVEGSRIVVVGGGDAAFDYTIGLAEKNDVTIVLRGKSARCLPALESRAKALENVTVRTCIRLTSVGMGGDGRLRLSGLRECDDGDSAGREGTRGGIAREAASDWLDTDSLEADYLVLAVGREPDDGFLSERVRSGFPGLAAGGGLLFAGDVRNGIFRQASIAAGQGTEAAMKVAASLRERAAEIAGRR